MEQWARLKINRENRQKELKQTEPRQKRTRTYRESHIVNGHTITTWNEQINEGNKLHCHIHFSLYGQWAKQKHSKYLLSESSFFLNPSQKPNQNIHTHCKIGSLGQSNAHTVGHSGWMKDALMTRCCVQLVLQRVEGGFLLPPPHTNHPQSAQPIENMTTCSHSQSHNLTSCQHSIPRSLPAAALLSVMNKVLFSLSNALA